MVGTSTPDEAGLTTQDVRARVEIIGSSVDCVFESGQEMFGERRCQLFSATRREEEEARCIRRHLLNLDTCLSFFFSILALISLSRPAFSSTAVRHVDAHSDGRHRRRRHRGQTRAD